MARSGPAKTAEAKAEVGPVVIVVAMKSAPELGGALGVTKGIGMVITAAASQERSGWASPFLAAMAFQY